MTNIAGMIACGKRGGPTFMNTIRVDPVTKECPQDTIPCSPYSDNTSTICIDPD